MKKKFPLLLFISSLLISCGSSHQERPATPQNPTEHLQIPSPGPGLPPTVCRVVATIVVVEPLSNSGNPDDPCRKAPCNAAVRIDSVLGYGSSFPGVLTPGDTVRTHFALTLAHTATMPGLGVGSRFLAELEGLPAIGPSRSYVVTGYEAR